MSNALRIYSSKSRSASCNETTQIMISCPPLLIYFSLLGNTYEILPIQIETFISSLHLIHTKNIASWIYKVEIFSKRNERKKIYFRFLHLVFVLYMKYFPTFLRSMENKTWKYSHVVPPIRCKCIFYSTFYNQTQLIYSYRRWKIFSFSV